jgi:formiminotetrahydrofolate cyclodeaminase
MLASRNLAQVSINLTDFEQTPLHLVFETVCREAERYGVPVVGSEIVGLIPRKAVEMAAEYFLRAENFSPQLVLENRIADAVAVRGGLPEFLDALAAGTATPGGGSAAAAAAAMGAALGAMVSRLAKLDPGTYEDDRAFFTAAVERDAAAFQHVMTAYRRPKGERAPFVEEALHGAALVPLEVLERAAALNARLEKMEVPARFSSDLAVAKALTAAARTGALENVRINLESMADAAFKAAVEARLSRLTEATK